MLRDSNFALLYQVTYKDYNLMLLMKRNIYVVIVLISDISLILL